MAITPGATLTPHFRDFLPGWVARQPWYEGGAGFGMVGSFRLEDRDGAVGLETHLVGDPSAVYQVPMSYRGAPLPGGALIAEAEHSVLGRRWIYDAVTDPVWTRELLALVAAGASAGPGGRAGSATAVGHLLRPLPTAPRIEVVRRLAPGPLPDAAGVLMGSWTQGPTPVEGPLVVVREPA